MPDNKYGSRLIVTTRILTVAEEACTLHSDIHHMQPLSFNDSKKLFVSRVFGADQSCPEYLAKVMVDILNKCGGLPLAIVSIASFLAAYKSPGSEDKWDIVRKSIGSLMEGGHPTLEGMKHILALSYNHLPRELKDCMMYLSIFPEDYEINKERLLNRWIAEGLIPEKRGLTLKQVAESYFDELLGRSMIVPGSFDHSGRMQSCRVHDILLELMVSKSLKSNFASLLGGQYAGMLYDRIRRLSIQGPDSDVTDSVHRKILGNGWGHGLEVMDVQHVRSLSLFHVQEHRLLDHLHKFTLLRVLDLEGCKEVKNKHMPFICRLYLLKFLSLKDTDISKVPSEVEKLEHLQVLDVQGTQLGVLQDNGQHHRGLSDKVTELKKLEHLLFSGSHCLHLKWILPKGVGKMKALRTVGIAILEDDDKIAQELGELKHLEAIWIVMGKKIRDSDGKVVKEFANSLGKMNSLRRLYISNDYSTDVLQFLHNLKPEPRFLRDIRIDGKVGNSLPDWIGKLSNLVELCMSRSSFRGDQPFSVLCQMPCLKSINMERACYTDVKLVARTRYNTNASSTININFPSLVSLEISANDKKEPEEFEIEKGSMTKLERLGMRMNQFGHKDRRIVGIKHLINLKEVQLMGKESDPALHNTLKQLKTENDTRSNKFRIVAKYF